MLRFSGNCELSLIKPSNLNHKTREFTVDILRYIYNLKYVRVYFWPQNGFMRIITSRSV